MQTLTDLFQFLLKAALGHQAMIPSDVTGRTKFYKGTSPNMTFLLQQDLPQVCFISS